MNAPPHRTMRLTGAPNDTEKREFTAHAGPANMSVTRRGHDRSSRNQPGGVMNRRALCMSLSLALAGCQSLFGPSAASDDSCPANVACDDDDTDAWSGPGPALHLADYQPLRPGCPTTHQVMARLHPIVFSAVRPDGESNSAPDDPSDWACEPPEPQLLRAQRGGTRTVAAR
jgi:hypothetical protein